MNIFIASIRWQKQIPYLSLALFINKGFNDDKKVLDNEYSMT